MPLVLYCTGDPRWLNEPAVGIVGSRKPTEYGPNAADIGGELANGAIIVSGLADGLTAPGTGGSEKLTAPPLQ